MWVRLPESFKVLDFPLDCTHILYILKWQNWKICIQTNEIKKKAFIIRKFFMQIWFQAWKCFYQFFIRNAFVCHSTEFFFKNTKIVLYLAVKQFVNRSVVTYEIYKKAWYNLLWNSPVIFIEIFYIEQISRMLSVKGSTDFSRIQFLEHKHIHLCIAEQLLNFFRNFDKFRFNERSSDCVVRLDFYRCLMVRADDFLLIALSLYVCLIASLT